MADPITFNGTLDPMVRIEAVDGGHRVRFQDCPKLRAEEQVFEEVWQAYEHGMKIALREDLPIHFRPSILAQFPPRKSR